MIGRLMQGDVGTISSRHAKKRGVVLGNLEKRFNLKFCRPEQVTVAFPQDNLFVDITRFNFLAQFHLLITDKSLTGDITQLDVPQDDPFGKYESRTAALALSIQV
jgi:hypothetical protein